MNELLPALIIELRNRCCVLGNLLEGTKHRNEILHDVKTTREYINYIKEQSDLLFHDHDFGAKQLLQNQIQSYKRLAEALKLVEWFQITFLLRYTDKDYYFSQLLRTIAQQINYSDTIPLITASSMEYYKVYLTRGDMPHILLVPVDEDMFLLSIPDLFHELGHIIFINNEDIMSGNFLRDLNRYIKNEKKRVDVETRPIQKELYDHLEGQWKENWVKEHVANMIATYLVGPSFGWSHLRLCANSSNNIYFPGMLDDEYPHPSFESQMMGILKILKLQGLNNEVRILENKWSNYKKILRDSPSPEYEFCYPDILLQSLATNVVNGCSHLGLASYTKQSKSKNNINLPLLLNDAWKLFLDNPHEYIKWEVEQVKRVRDYINRS